MTKLMTMMEMKCTMDIDVLKSSPVCRIIINVALVWAALLNLNLFIGINPHL